MTPLASYSAHVTLELWIDTVQIPLAQLACDFAILQKPLQLEPCEGEIRMTIDGSETRIPVYLPEGIRADRLRFKIAPAPVGMAS